MAIKCHYCGNEELKKYAWVENKFYSWHCEPCQKNNTESHIESCLVCGKEFEFRYDPGWNENIVCWPCQQKSMKDFFNDPKTKKEFEKAMKEPYPFLPKGDSGFGGYIPVPVFYKSFGDSEPEVKINDSNGIQGDKEKI